MDWRADQNLSELWDIIHMVGGGVEDIPIADIRTACDEKGISCDRFITAWEALCNEAEIIMGQAESRMTNEH
jgi:hypothetical protein